VQGYGLTGTQPVPGQVVAANPIRRFFFIITGKL
jgi:hypothetical protein